MGELFTTRIFSSQENKLTDDTQPKGKTNTVFLNKKDLI